MAANLCGCVAYCDGASCCQGAGASPVVGAHRQCAGHGRAEPTTRKAAFLPAPARGLPAPGMAARQDGCKTPIASARTVDAPGGRGGRVRHLAALRRGGDSTTLRGGAGLSRCLLWDGALLSVRLPLPSGARVQHRFYWYALYLSMGPGPLKIRTSFSTLKRCDH